MRKDSSTIALPPSSFAARRSRRRGMAALLELLEQRVAPAAVITHWIGDSGSWNDPAHWDNGVPNNANGTTYTAIIEVGALNPVVTVDAAILVSSLVNAESIQITAGHTSILAALDNTGSITVGTSGVLSLESGVTGLTTAKLGAIHVTGGTFALTASLDNTGSSLMLDVTTGSWQLAGGTILGGTIGSSNGSKLSASSAEGTLDGVTLNAGLDLTADPSGDVVTILHGLTLNGTATVGANSFLNFVDTQTLGGTGSVFFNSSQASGLLLTSSTPAAPTLTIGSLMKIHGGSSQAGGAQIGDSDYLGTISGGTLINEGTISADVSGTTLFLNRVAVVNHGTIEAVNGGSVNIGNLSTNSGTISAAGLGQNYQSSHFTIGGTHWTNTGTLSSTDTWIFLGGSFTVAGLGTTNFSDEGVYLTGTLENTGTTLNLVPAQAWHLYGGAIIGGTVQGAPDAKLVLTDKFGRLDGVTLNTNLDVPGYSLMTGADIYHGLTLNGVAQMGELATLSFHESQTLGGTGSVIFAGDQDSSLRVVDSGSIFTIGPNMTIDGENSWPGNGYGGYIGWSHYFGGPTDFTVVNEGTISAGLNTGRIVVAADRFINAGTIDVPNGGHFYAHEVESAERKVLTKTSAPFTYYDADDTLVRVKWLGAGSASLIRLSDPNSHYGELFSITTNGSDLTSSLSITTGGAGATSVEEITINGALKSLTAPTTSLLGDVTSTRSVGALTFYEAVSGSTIKIGPRAVGDTKTTTSLTFDQVADLQIDSATPLLAVTAAQWLDRDATPDVITAPSLGTLTVKAAPARGLAPDFEAGLNLTGVGVAARGLTLGKAVIAGKIADSDWKVTGNVGAITAAATAADWSTHFTGSLVSLTTTGNASGDLHVGARATGDLTTRTSLNFDTAAELSIRSLTPIFSLTTRNWTDQDATADVVQAPSLGSLTVKGDTRPARLLAGDFAADLTLSGAGVAATAKTLTTVNVKGKIDAATWSITGGAGAITAGSTGATWNASFTGGITSLTASTLSGSLHAASIATVKADNLSHFTLALTQAVSPTLKALGTLTVKNAIDSSEIRAAGNIGTVTVAKVLHSRLFAGVQSGVSALPQTGADFAAVATIAKVVVTGTTNLADPGMLDSSIAASKITAASITRFATANNGVAYGLAADSIASLTLKTAAGTVTQTNLNGPTADASAGGDDFVVRIV